MNWRSIDYRILVGLGVMAFFGIALLYALEIPYFNRYFSFAQILIFSEIFGLLLGGVGAWYWTRQVQDSYDRLRLWVGLLVAGILFGPLFFSLLNRQLDPWPVHWESVELVELEDRFKSRYGITNPDEMPESNTFYLYFYRDTELIRIVFDKKPDLGDSKKGAQIGIKVHRGLFGVQWVQDVRPNGLDVM